MTDGEGKLTCPLLAMGGYHDASCVGGRCAWWVRADRDCYSGCAVLKLAERMSNVSYFLRLIGEG